jgi:hypothetical protein
VLAWEEAYAGAKQDMHSDVLLKHHVEQIELPRREVTEREWQLAKGSVAEFSQQAGKGTMKWWHQQVVDGYERQQAGTVEPFTMELHTRTHRSHRIKPTIPRHHSSNGRPARAETQPGKQGHFCIFHGLTFGNWVRLLASRPPLHWTRIPRLASVTAFSVVNSVEKLLENLVYGRRIKELKFEHPPIFIIGHWRSGTTLLHNLMPLDPQFTYPNLYQVMFPGSFLLTEKTVARLTRWGVPQTRSVDNLPAGWDMTQEDEVAMLAMTMLSPYVMLAH